MTDTQLQPTDGALPQVEVQKSELPISDWLDYEPAQRSLELATRGRRQSKLEPKDWQPVYLASLAADGVQARALRNAGVLHHVVEHYQKVDPQFREACATALEHGLHHLEEVLYQHATTKRDGNILGVFSLLKARRPIFRDRVEHTGKDGAPIAISSLVMTMKENAAKGSRVIDVEAEPSNERAELPS